MLIHLSELFNCEGRKKVYTVETALDSVDFDGETFQIEKAEPFELELTAKTRHKYHDGGHATLTVGGHCARCLEPVSFDCELDFGQSLRVQDGQEESLDDEPFMKGVQSGCRPVGLQRTATELAYESPVQRRLQGDLQ
ncbi:MAG: hypothetical protein ACLR8P_06805 [Clostridium fessum]